MAVEYRLSHTAAEIDSKIENALEAVTLTSEEYDALDEVNANTLYMLSDGEEDEVVDETAREVAAAAQEAANTHASRHASGGADPITPAMIGAVAANGYISDNSNVDTLADGVYQYNGWASSSITCSAGLPFTSAFGIWIKKTMYNEVGITANRIDTVINCETGDVYTMNNYDGVWDKNIANAVNKAGDTMTGNLNIVRDSYPGITLQDIAQNRFGQLFYNENEEVVLQNVQNVSDVDNRTLLFLRNEDNTDGLMQLSKVNAGQWTSYNVLHTGNKSLIAPADIGAAIGKGPTVPEADLLSWATNQGLSQSFVVNPTITTENVPVNTWFTGHLDFCADGAWRITMTDIGSSLWGTTYTNVTSGGVWLGWKQIVNTDTALTQAGYWSGTDLNEFLSFDCIITVTEKTNKPANATPYATVWNMAGVGSAYLIQYYFDAATRTIYRRHYVDGVWDDWIYDITSGNKNLIAPADIGAAPAGFGLGTIAKNISSTDLLTTLASGQSGFYMGDNITNAPDSSWWFFIVICHNHMWSTVLALPFTGAAGIMYVGQIRDVNSSASWGGWTSVITGANIASQSVHAASYAHLTANADPATASLKNINAGTTDLTAGTSSLTSGQIYLVYE